jgi:hypothetical protein
MSTPRILYCHCAHAQVVPKEIKEAVLKRLCDSGVSFEAVADLCEMSARQDPALKRLAEDGCVKIAACSAAPGGNRSVEHACAERGRSIHRLVQSRNETQSACRKGNETVTGGIARRCGLI